MDDGSTILFGKSPNEKRGPYNTNDPYWLFVKPIKNNLKPKARHRAEGNPSPIRRGSTLHLKPGKYELTIEANAINRNKAWKETRSMSGLSER